MRYIYLCFLVFSISGLLFADWKHKLVVFRSPKRALFLWLAGMLFFLSWDITGIILNVFSTNREWVSGIHFFTSNMPLEELFFLTLFLFNTALVWRLVCLRTS